MTSTVLPVDTTTTADATAAKPAAAAKAHPTYNPKTFHRKFEESCGFLTPDQFPEIDWADRDQVEMLFPAYRREQIKKDKERKGKVSKIVEIEPFTLRTPYNDRDLFKNTKLYIEPHKRCAVYGVNGSGKTALFKAITEGKIKEFPKWMHVHHMKELEHDEKADNVSVKETVLCSSPMYRVLICMEAYLKELVAAEDKESPRRAKLKDNLEYIGLEMRKISAATAEDRVSGMLRVLGFDEEGEAAPLNSLSGGLRMRCALASAFFIDPELLLLDEPTNHLDMPSVLWLENRLRGYKGSYLLVTHDRTLLENVVTSVMLIQDLKLEYFTCGFKEFEKRKVKLDQKRDEMIDKFLERNRNLDTSSPLYRTKKNYQEWQQKRQERMVLLAGKFNFKAPKALKAPEGVEQKDISLIKVDNVRFSYNVEKGLPFIFDNPVSYEVKQGTRVGVMGPNGAGKSTFLKLITGKIFPTEGTITTNPDYTLAYFGQHSTKELKMDMTPFEFMQASFPDANVGKLKLHLEKTSIANGPANTRMENLSFSQRSCVIFAKLTFVPPHLLIMDEPTNFLDLESVDSLIRAANGFPGAVITVTHNRDFLKKTSSTFLSIVPGAFLEFNTMKAAERATYSFITALEKGEAIDVKSAIMDNRGGGARHTEEYLAASKARLDSQQLKAQQIANEKKAAEDLAAKRAREKEERRLKKLAEIKLDWKQGETCWVAQSRKGNVKYIKATVLRNIPAMGVSVEMVTGKKMMIDAKKLKQKNPNPAPKGGAKGGRGGGGRRNGGGRGGRRNGGGRGGRRNGGGRGGRGGGRRGGRGGARS